MEEYREMISFQWITLSFLLVSGALFAYLIPLLQAYVRYPAAGKRHRHLYRQQTAWSYQRQNHPGLCKGGGRKEGESHRGIYTGFAHYRVTIK